MGRRRPAVSAGGGTARRTAAVDLTPLIRHQDLDTWDPEDYYVAYWDRDRWQPVDRPIVRTTGMAADGSPAHSYTVSGLPERAIYGIFRRSDDRTYHRRIFRAWKGEPTRF